MNKLGYIMTVRGRTGGIRLARSPAQINVGALVRAVEEDFSLVECLQQSGGACVISPACMLKSMFSEALTAYLSVLDKYTLADAVRNRTALATLLGVTPMAA